jgi:hypothetical protein
MKKNKEWTFTPPSAKPQKVRGGYEPPLENNPIRQMQQIKGQIRGIINNLNDDVGNVKEAKAKALFESTAELLARVVKDFDDYANRLKTFGESISARGSYAKWPSDGISSLHQKRHN